jgi:hypothetical protein
MNKYDIWWNSLPQHTKDYIKKQPIWHDRDIFKALALGMAMGLVIGAIV